MTFPLHVVELMCACPDPDRCATNDLVADRNTGWKEAFRMRDELLALQQLLSTPGVGGVKSSGG